MTEYIIRNGGFQQKEQLSKKPLALKTGTEIICLYQKGQVTKGRTYRIIGHFCYLNTYGVPGEKYTHWDQFVTIKNDSGWTAKMNLNNFYVVPASAMEVLSQTI